GFAIKHMLKDLRLVQEISQGLGQDSDLKDFATNLPAIALAIKNFQKVSQLDDGQGTEQGTQAMIRAY
ncbi:MAG: oxidoreductase, partial [Pseudanabaena sp.]